MQQTLTAWYAGTIYFVYNFYAFSVPVSFNSNVHDIKHNLTISYLVYSPGVNCTPLFCNRHLHGTTSEIAHVAVY